MMHKQAIAVSLSFVALSAGAISLSQECTKGFSDLSANAEASKCLGLNQFQNIFLAPANSSVIKPVENWLNAFCGAAECSNTTITSVVTSIATACAADLATLEIDASQVQLVIPYIQQFFGTAKKVLCLADTTKSEFCAVGLGTSIQTATGKPLSLDNLYDAYDSVIDTHSSPVDKSLICTPCTQGVYSVLESDPQVAALVGTAVNTQLSKTCGAEFVASTAMPANIAVGTGANVPKGGKKDDSGAFALAASGLSIVVSVFTLAFLA